MYKPKLIHFLVILFSGRLFLKALLLEATFCLSWYVVLFIFMPRVLWGNKMFSFIHSFVRSFIHSFIHHAVRSLRQLSYLSYHSPPDQINRIEPVTELERDCFVLIFSVVTSRWSFVVDLCVQEQGTAYWFSLRCRQRRDGMVVQCSV